MLSETLQPAVPRVEKVVLPEEGESIFEEFDLETVQNCDAFFRKSIHLFSEVYKVRDEIGVTKHKSRMRNAEVDGYASFRRNYVTLKMCVREIKSILQRGEVVTDVEIDRAQVLYNRLIKYHDRVVADSESKGVVYIEVDEVAAVAAEAVPRSVDFKNEIPPDGAIHETVLAVDLVLSRIGEVLSRPASRRADALQTRVDLEKVMKGLLNLRNVLQYRAREQDIKVRTANIARTTAIINNDVREATKLLKTLSAILSKQAVKEIDAKPAAVSIIPAALVATEKVDPVVDELVEIAVAKPTPLILRNADLIQKPVTETDLLASAENVPEHEKVDAMPVVSPELSAYTRASAEFDQVHAIPYLTAEERTTAKGVYEGALNLAKSGKSAEVVDRAIVNLRRHIDDLAHPQPDQILERVQMIKTEMAGTAPAGRDTASILALTENVERIAAEEAAAPSSDGTRTAGAYKTLVDFMDDDTTRVGSEVVAEREPENAVPLDKARLAYRDALLQAIKVKFDTRTNQKYAQAGEHEHFMEGALATVALAGDAYYKLAAGVVLAQGSSNANQEITDIEADFYKEKKTLASRIKRLALILTPAAFLLTADISQHHRVPENTTPVASPNAAPLQVASPERIDAMPPVVGEEVISGVVLESVVVAPSLESAPVYSPLAEQLPDDAGVTLSYPTDHRLDIPVSDNDWRAAVSTEQPVVSVTPPTRETVTDTPLIDEALARGWGVNNPGVTIAEVVPEQSVGLGEGDIAPQLQTEERLVPHRYTNGEGLWNVTMGTTEIGDVPEIVGQSDEARREIWRDLTILAKTDAAFRTSLGAVRIAANGEPWIYASTPQGDPALFNVAALNQFVKDWKAVRVQSSVLEMAPTVTVQATAESAVPATAPERVAITIEAPQVTLEDTRAYIEQFPGGPAALEDAVSGWVKQVQGVYTVAKSSFLNIFQHHQKDPYEALAHLSLREIRAMVTLKDLSALEHKLAELNISAGGLGVWAAKVKQFLLQNNSFGVDDLSLEEAAKYMYVMEKPLTGSPRTL